MKLIVIGAGLAGAACAQAFAARGWDVTVLSQGGGASQLPVGLLAAHLSSHDIELSQLSRMGVARTLSHARALLREGMDWQPCRLQQKLLFHADKTARLRQGAAALPDWYALQGDDVLHLQAAWIKPQALVQVWLAQARITLLQASVAHLRRGDHDWQALDEQGQCIAQADHIIIATGAESIALLQQWGHAKTMDAVPGSVAFAAWQAEEFQSAEHDASPVINGNGHFIGNITSENGGAIWLSGSTYERETHDSPAAQQAASLRANHERLTKLLPADWLRRIDAQFAKQEVSNWQGSRCTTSDRLPVLGQLEPGLHASTAMGSRGLSFAALCADILAQELTAPSEPLIVSARLRRELLPHRKTLKVSSP